MRVFGFFLFAALLFGAGQNASASVANGYVRLCHDYLNQSRTSGGSAVQDDILCSKMNTRPKAFCVGYMILNRIDGLAARGWAWSPSYKTLGQCSRITNVNQYEALKSLITDYRIKMDQSEIDLALKAQTKAQAECFISIEKVAVKVADLKSCVN